MSNNKQNKSLTPFYIVVAVLAVLIVSTFTAIKNGLNLGLDLVGGFEILYEVSPLNEDTTATIDMNAVTNSIQKRVNVLGVSEPMITVEGTNRVRVQLAGVADQESAREMIGTTANLTFRDANDELLADSSIITEGGASLAYQDGRPIVSLKIADQSKFAEITADISSRSGADNVMIIWLDWEEGNTYKEEYQKYLAGEEPKYISAASVKGTINGDCIIEGNFTDNEARTLAELINSGSLPVKMTEISSNVVSAQYGADALKRTALAGFLGVLLVLLFMIWQYRLPGVISVIMLAGYIWVIFGLYMLMGAVFTLTAIGALVLGVGMTVDANIISYERIRQELYRGRSVRSAVAEGQKQSFSAIFDAQFTTLIAGLIMYIWGNGAVRGFATMLVVTVVATLVVNVAFSRWLLNQIVNSGKVDDKPELFGVKKSQIPDVSKGESQFYYGIRGYDYVKNAKYLICTSLAILAVALCVGIGSSVGGKGFMNLGIDFAAGTKLTITSDTTVTIDEVKSELAELGYTNFSYQAAGDSTVYATTKTSLTVDELKKIKSVFSEKYGQEPGDNVVTPVVGKELVRNAFILTIVAWIAMLAYIAFRYEWDYAVSCLVALIHDVLITLSLFVILRLEVNTEVISVLLTIIGYSINNSIVVFDRVRETVRECKGKIDYKGIVNDALDKTLIVSIFSSITTLLPVVMLLLLGSRSIFTFTFAMLVGMIAGTFSSIFVAPRLWCWIRENYKPKQRTKKKEQKEQLDEYTIKGINA
ncbi:MAG: protein translocase subunit SecD [Solobacterium sp.]|nr:protein translocase subunit SecD [Solobacterium sp.]